MSNINAIIITNVDSLLGYAAAYRFLEEWNRVESSHYAKLRDVTDFRLLCHERQGLEELELLGGKIFEFKHYERNPHMQEIINGAGYVMLIPENSDQRIEEGKAIIQCAKEQGVEYLAMFSITGLDQMGHSTENHNKMKNLKQFLQLEQVVSDTFDKDSYCIFRSSMWNQFFYYFGPLIEDENEIRLTVPDDCEFSLIDMADLLDAVYNLSKGEHDDASAYHNLSELYIANLKKKNQTLFEVTATKNITPKGITKAVSQALGYHDMTYKKIDEKEMHAFLRKIRQDNRFRLRPDQKASDITSAKDDEDLGRDRPYTFPLGRYLNDNLIDTLVEQWELIGSGKVDKLTNHLEKSLHRDLQSFQDFLRTNRDQFKHLR